MAVRREAVVLELEDRFTRPTLQAAAAAKTLDKALDDLDGTAIRTDKSITPLNRNTADLGRTSRNVGSDLDRLSGRMAIVARIGASIGPGLLPIAAVGVPAVTGLASSLGFAAVGMASLVAASQGVGDALEAVNAAALEPTAENLEKAREAMSRLAPEAQMFVERFQDLRPALGDIRDAAAAGWFPGLTSALGDFERVAPFVGDLFERIGRVGGGLVAEGASAFAGPEWDDFRAFILREAPPALDLLGRSVGNVASGMADLWMAFAPLNSGFTTWMFDMSRGFDEWASNLSQTEGFREFIEYVQVNGPKVADLAGAVADALIQIAQAAAPLGGPVLDALTGIARAIAAIADSPLGTPLMAMVTALSAMSLAARGATAAQNALNGALARTRGAAGSGIAAYGRHAAVLGGLAISATGAADSIGLTNTMSMALMGTMGGPWGTVLGGALGLTMDITNANRSWEDSIRAVDTAIASGSRSMMIAELEQQKQLLEELTAMEDPDSFGEMAWNLPTMTGWWISGAPDVEQRIAATSDRIDYLRAALRGADGAQQDYIVTVQGSLLWQERLRARLHETREAARESGQAFLDFSDAIVQADKFSLDRYLKQLENQVRALANFRDNIDRLRSRGLAGGVIDELIRQGPAAAQAVEALANGSDRAIDRMNSAFRGGRKEMRGLTADAVDAKKKVEELGDTPANPTIDADSKPFRREKTAVDHLIDELSGRTATPKVVIDTSAVGAAVGAVTSMLNNIDDEIVYIKGVRTGAAIGAASADGSTVPKTGLPYADRHLYLLADGEEIISNRRGQADRHRALLKAINAGRLSDGGTAWAMARSRASERHMSGGGGAAAITVNPSVSLDGLHLTVEIPGFGRQAVRVIDARIDAHDRHVATLEGR